MSFSCVYDWRSGDSARMSHFLYRVWTIGLLIVEYSEWDINIQIVVCLSTWTGSYLSATNVFSSICRMSQIENVNTHTDRQASIGVYYIAHSRSPITLFWQQIWTQLVMEWLDDRPCLTSHTTTSLWQFTIDQSIPCIMCECEKTNWKHQHREHSTAINRNKWLLMRELSEHRAASPWSDAK